ncbi:uncharacterized protein LOC101857264 [Aplysia californica]|uniref:Uncharacterized protein LOC101857264 n=1 Tax=Aplysia californica TaxID=6500 RepID=A0ABM1A4T4_APLCA|nr:uncharacterized protein LOC101857264 [Aplysia californica]XP_012940847.1 uncharacterized protein LOC101857264 [Aplysia californica]
MANTTRFDIVIGYNVSDLEFVQKLAEKLRSSSMSVWYTNPDGDATQTSDAILGCKIYLPVMTEESAVDKHIQEQLSLAYISNSAIYPLSRIRFRFLSPKLSGGAKLMLAKINWCFVFSMDEFEEKTDAIIKCMRRDLENMTSERGEDEHLQNAGFFSTHGVTVAFSHGLELGGDGSGFDGVIPGVDLSTISGDTHFWDRHFKGETEVSWTDFRDRFLQDYGGKIKEEFSEYPEERTKFFVNLMYKDIFELSKRVRRSVYDHFCLEFEPHSFFNRLQQYVLAYMSLREVISMDSSLRIPTIQSLGQYSFPAIVSGLSDMLKDDDPNIRAVAAIALAHAGKQRPSTVDKLLGLMEDEDRLVRESACLSLGFLRSTKAVPYIVDRWRNDPISTVREAAELALSKMETSDAKRCMKVTQVLSSEMKALNPSAVS